jgi:DNA-3-methyladenine glycosylase
MRARRGGLADRLLCAGPGRLCAALGVDGRLDGATAVGPGAAAWLGARTGPVEIATGPRIGITKAADRPWRFGLAGSPYLSRAFPRA